MKKILLKHWKYLSVAILIIVLVFISLNYKEKEETFDIKETIITSDIVSDKVYVQISGEVNNPGVYEVNSNDEIQIGSAPSGTFQKTSSITADGNAWFKGTGTFDGGYIVVNGRRIYIQSSQPSEARTGDVWFQI